MVSKFRGLCFILWADQRVGEAARGWSRGREVAAGGDVERTARCGDRSRRWSGRQLESGMRLDLAGDLGVGEAARVGEALEEMRQRPRWVCCGGGRSGRDRKSVV